MKPQIVKIGISKTESSTQTNEINVAVAAG